jgi:predicted transcriptional regulator
MRAASPTAGLGAREREILEVLYALGDGTATDVRSRLKGSPSDSAVRTMLQLLESKGHVRHRRDGRQYRYEPTVPRDKASRSALAHVIDTFFGGSIHQVMTTMVRDNARKLSPEDLARLRRVLDEAG